MFGLARLAADGLRVVRRNRPRHRRRASRPARCLLLIEPLEDRTLLAVSIAGTIFHDLNGNGALGAGEPGLPAATAFLDRNANGLRDQQLPFSANGTPALTAGTGAFSGTLLTAPISVSGFAPGSTADVRVNLNVQKVQPLTGGGSVTIALISPAGFVLGAGPNLVTLNPTAGNTATFNGTLTDTAATTPPTVTGNTADAFRPLQPFTDAARLVYNGAGNPNGGWRLLVFGNTAGVTVNSWSLEFKAAEQTAVTDSAGNYTFDDLPAGSYRVGAANAPGGPNPGSNAVVLAGAPTNGVNIAVVSPNADLTGVGFRVTGATAWGGSATVDWTVTNRGPGDAAPFAAEIRLSRDGTLDGADILLATLQLGALGAGKSVSGQTVVQLPGSPPSGFGDLDLAVLGLRIDPANAIAETDEGNNANRGGGLDQSAAASLGNRNLTGAAGAQQQPSLAVNPSDSRHLVLAYLDYAQKTNGFAGLAVKVSRDGGNSWVSKTIPLPTDFNDAAGYPVVKFDAGGRVYVSFTAAKFLGASRPPVIFPDGTSRTGPAGSPLTRTLLMEANNGVFVVRSDDGGDNWGGAQAVASRLYGGTTKVPFDTLPDLAIDPTSGKLYVSFTRYYPAGQFPGATGTTHTGGSDVWTFSSADQGATWKPTNQTGVAVPSTPPIRPNTTDATEAGSGLQSLARIAVAPNGDVFVSLLDGTGGRFRVFRSTNGGVTFTATDGNVAANDPFTNNQAPTFPNYTAEAGMPFRNLPTRAIVADPTRPGTVYVAEAIAVSAPGGTVTTLDQAEINFARSTNDGTIWQRNFTVGGSSGNLDTLGSADLTRYRSAVNDDNGNRYLRSVTDFTNEVRSRQATPSLVVDNLGNVIAVWLDTRRDPGNRKIDVFAAVSTDGGRTFGSNFRVTDFTFDALDGAFTDGAAASNIFLGDGLGLAATDGVVYVAWTDTRAGSQDVFFTRFRVAPQPAHLSDRFEPNNAAVSSTNLGQVSVLRVFPRLTVADADFYRVTPSASGSLNLAVTGSADLSLQVFDAAGTTVLGIGTDLRNAAGQVIGKQVVLEVTANVPLLAHVAGPPGASVAYSLSVQALTADLGARVFGTQERNLPAAGQHVYALTAPVAGSVSVQLNGLNTTGNLTLRLLAADGVTVLGTATATGPTGVARAAAVRQGQGILIQVAGANAAANGNYRLAFTNLDQFQTALQSAVFFPTQGDPATLAAGRLNADLRDDVIAVSSEPTNPVSVLLNDGTGLLGAPRVFDGGTGGSQLPGGSARGVTLAEFTGDLILDPAFTNFPSYDVTVLPGRGNGDLGSDRRSDAQAFPGSLAAGRFDNDPHTDLVVFPVTTVVGESPKIAILKGRGDGTFLPPQLIQTALPSGSTFGAVADFNADGKDDVIVFSVNGTDFEVYLGNGDGTFAAAVPGALPEPARAAVAADLNGDGSADLVTGSTVSGNVHTLISAGNGTFTRGPSAFANTDPARASSRVLGLAVADAGGAAGLGVADGRLDVFVVMEPVIGNGAPQVNFLAGAAGPAGTFAPVRQIATGRFIGPIAVGNFDNDTRPDVVVAEPGGVRVLYNAPLTVTPNTTPQTARDLGEFVHLVTPKQAISPNFLDAFFSVTVPTEAVAGSGDQVIDFSALFENLEGAGLRMEVLDAGGAVLGSGERFRVRAAQGAVLTVRVFAATAANGARGAGACTLSIDVLPQLVSVEAASLLPGQNGAPGGPVTTLVLTFQGDRLDPATAENTANYRITFLGADGVHGTADDQVVVPGGGGVGRAAVYAPGANTVVSSGRTYPTAARQTVTLFFSDPLPAGSYRVEVLAGVQSVDFNGTEDGRLAGGAGFAGHPVVSLPGGAITIGVDATFVNLVLPAGALGSLDLSAGTKFLTQFHGNAGAQLSALQEQLGDSPQITPAINDQIIAAFGPGAAGVPILVIWLDPVSIDLADPQGQRTVYNLPTNTLNNNIARAFVEVGGNIQVLVLAGLSGTFTLTLSDVQPQARGGAVIVANGQARPVALTDAIRSSSRTFQFDVPEQSGGVATLTAGAPAGGAAGGAASAGTGPTNPGAGTAPPSGGSTTVVSTPTPVVPPTAPAGPAAVVASPLQNLTLINAALVSTLGIQPGGEAAAAAAAGGAGQPGTAVAGGPASAASATNLPPGNGEEMPTSGPWSPPEGHEIDVVTLGGPGAALYRLIRSAIRNGARPLPPVPGPGTALPAPAATLAAAMIQPDAPEWFEEAAADDAEGGAATADVLPVAGRPAPLHGLLSAAVFAAGLCRDWRRSVPERPTEGRRRRDDRV